MGTVHTETRSSRPCSRHGHGCLSGAPGAGERGDTPETMPWLTWLLPFAPCPTASPCPAGGTEGISFVCAHWPAQVCSTIVAVVLRSSGLWKGTRGHTATETWSGLLLLAVRQCEARVWGGVHSLRPPGQRLPPDARSYNRRVPRRGGLRARPSSGV